MKKSNLKRRYEKGQYPIYDKEFADFYDKSHILNPSRRRNMSDLTMNHRKNWDNSPKEAQVNLLEIKGNDQGEYYRNGNPRTASLTLAKEEYGQVKAEFKVWAKKQVAIGECLNPPEDKNRNYPEGILTRKLKAEALLDINKQEIKVLEDFIENNKTKEQKLKDKFDKMFVGQWALKLGPMGKVALDKEQERIKKVDNQNVSYKGPYPYIDEPESPYDNMLVVHYKKMSKAWREENDINLFHGENSIRARAKAYYAKLEEHLGRSLGFTPDSEKNFVQYLLGQKEWPDGVKPKDSVWPDWPKWPKFAKPIDELELDAA